MLIAAISWTLAAEPLAKWLFLGRLHKGKQYAEKNPTQAPSTQLALQKRVTSV